MSKLPPACVTSKGWSTIIRSVSRPKYSPKDRLLIDIAPLPFRKKTRATEVFLLPVAVVTFSAIDLVLLCFNHQRFWLLCFVGMLRTRIDLEFVDQFSTQTIFWQHPLNSLADQMLWFFFQHPFRGSFPDTAGILRVSIIALLLKFFPRERERSCINDNH